MAVRNLVLAQIIERDSYGYELADRLRNLFGALGVSDAAVYMALKSLEEKELITPVGGDPASGRSQPRRKIYTATAAGRQHHDEWMGGAGAPRKTAFRTELHFRMLLAQEEDIPSILKALDEVEADCEEQLAAIACFADWESKHSNMLSDFGSPLVEDGLTMQLQSTMEWVHRCRRALENRSAARPATMPGRDRP